MKRPPGMLAAALACALLAGGCVSYDVRKANAEPVIEAEHDIPEQQLLDVGVAVLDPGIPEDEAEREKQGVFPEVRKTEARLVAYEARDTLQSTSQWGAVRMVPRDASSVDVLVTGEMLESDGEILRVRFHVEDATGRVWLDKEYEDLASKFAYREDIELEEDPFQDIYNSLANDMLAVRKELGSPAATEIRQVARLRFASELSPYAFGNYLAKDEQEGRYSIERLPAEGDPMLERVEDIRQRDYLFIDTLDAHYAGFSQDVQIPYDDWRKYSYEEVIALREVRRSARNRMLAGIGTVIGGAVMAGKADSYIGQVGGYAGVVGGIGIFKSGLDRRKESQIHEDALRELADSLQSELKPMVVDIEGKTVTLTGTVDAQYEEWRRLLKDIYTAETGVVVDGSGEDPDISIQTSDNRQGTSE
ncbi:MAG: hypothetical protein H0W33_08975 [Gammaproteobacteria bacterium]|nr:hypothetical protein [Gammaproteobacteria bacterium]